MKYITFEDVSGKLIYINLDQVGAFFVSPYNDNPNRKCLNFCFNNCSFVVTNSVADTVSQKIVSYWGDEYEILF